MRAAVTRDKGVIEVAEVPAAGSPGAGEVIVRPEVVGLCGSDLHYFLGDIGGFDDPSQLYPRIQGHEASAVVEEVGPDCPQGLEPGLRVAIWPVVACGECYPCRIGRANACAEISLVGIHRDGALQERLRLPAAQAFPVGDQDAVLTALVEPVSIGVRAVERGRVAAGEKVVVLGAGPIGQAVALAAVEREATVLLLDRFDARLELGRLMGADVLKVGEGDPFPSVREWAGAEGPEVVVEATGVPELVRYAVELAAQTGRVVVVGLSSRAAPIRVGALPFKEIDLLGVSCSGPREFGEAVTLVGRHRDAVAALVTHEFSLERTAEAMSYAMKHPAEVMKAIVRIDGSP